MSTFLNHLLKTHFGYTEFRESQQAIIQRTIDGSNSLVIMPTGGGKSLCYQLPAIALKGTAIVISPLIALMHDQVNSLRANGITAAALNSSSTNADINDTISKIGTEDLKLLYVSPERAVTSSFLHLVKGKKISLIAIDEAHCVSIWGNDFRQEYTALPELTRHFPIVPVLVLTATADKATREDIVEKLKLRDPQVFISSFERKNIFIKVLPAARRMDSILDFVKTRKEESGIIYCLSRRSTEEVAEKLRSAGVQAYHYHAELSAQERNGVQQGFQQDEIKVVCATIAFGMGIDKSNVRYVLHYNLPKNLESYYQEIGRAGRDGLPAEALLYYSTSDAHILRQFIDKSEADESYKIVQRAKLIRMIEFGISTSCRTNMILSYFGEYRGDPCGHCDICKNPPRHFDGTVIAQKALSAAKRLNGKVATHMLADILRGSKKKEIFQLGFNEIKTFGAGLDITRDEWISYISQLVNQGYMEINFTDFNKLNVTTLGDQVLYNKFKVHLSQARPGNDSRQKITPKSDFYNGLFNKLRELRTEMAKEENVPAYVIFNDATLMEIAKSKPLYSSDLALISGVGKYKLQKYGDAFLEEVRKYIKNNSLPVKVRGTTYLNTLELLKQGLEPKEVASQRNVTISTIYTHIAYLYEKGEDIDIREYLKEHELTQIEKSWLILDRPLVTKDLYEHLNEKFDHSKLRMAIAFLKRPNDVVSSVKF